MNILYFAAAGGGAGRYEMQMFSVDFDPISLCSYGSFISMQSAVKRLKFKQTLQLELKQLF